MSDTVILVGAARSGTKFLRDILATSEHANCVPYDVNYVWRYGLENHPDDALPVGLLSQKARKFIPSTLRKLAKINATDTHTKLIEKTVSNGLRLPYVHAVYPNAKYVHLIRDGRAVTESAMRLWQAPPDWAALWKKFREMPLSNVEYALWFGTNTVKGLFDRRGGGKVWGPRYPGIEKDLESKDLLEICSLQWLHSVQVALEGLKEIPASQTIEVRYEDLVSDENTLASLCEFIGLSDPETVLAAYRKRVQGGQNDKWLERIDPANRERMTEIMGEGLKQLGFLER